MSDTQNWQEQLQQKVGDLLVRRIGTFAEELQQVQTSLNNLGLRLAQTGCNVSIEETQGLQEQFHEVRREATQEAESGFQSRLEEAVSQAEKKVHRQYEQQVLGLQTQLDAAGQAEAGSIQGLNQGLNLAAATGPENSVTGQPGYDKLKAAISDIDAQRQQADVLTALVRHSSHFAPRALFFVIKGGQAIGWKANGFTNGLTDDTVRSLNIPVQSNSPLNEAFTSATMATTQDGFRILGAFASPPAQYSVALPLVIRGKVAAILFADSGPENGAVLTDALETLMQVTGMAVELLPVRRSSQPAGATPVAAQPAVETPRVEPVQAEPPPEPAHTPAPEPRLEAAVSTQAPTPAASEVEVSVGAPDTVRSAFQATSPAPSSASEDEVRAHNDARRFARLLVSEIKLYNEQKVLDGRRSSDLYERLKEDIDRSRQMYEKRVSSSVSAKFDYFHDELLHTLGDGDTGKLGRGCPGPSVTVS